MSERTRPPLQKIFIGVQGFFPVAFLPQTTVAGQCVNRLGSLLTHFWEVSYVRVLVETFYQ